jgi:Xaa-Pro dipeptidase
VPGFLDRRRAARLMAEQELSALVLCQPETITYAAGAFPGVATFWRRAGAAFLIVPADASAPLTAIVGDLQAASFAAQSAIADVRSHRIWVETGRYPFVADQQSKRRSRPQQYDFGAALGLLSDALREKGCKGARVGLELGFVPAADAPAFEALPFDWHDCTRLVERLRAIKCPAEIGMLRNAAEFAASGIAALATAMTAGMDQQHMTEIWRDAAHQSAVRRGMSPPQSSWAYIAVAGDGFAPGGPAKPGDIIKIDVGCVINGYSSDGGRTAVLGSPSADAQRVFDALHRAFDAGSALLRPGMPLNDIHRATATAMWDQGFESYGRGHFGHGVGASIWSEEWPFISAESDAVLEPGMVMAFETPWYIDGLGGFIIEDQVLITETGCEVMAPSPRGLIHCR